MVARVAGDLFGPATIENFKKLGIDATHVKQMKARRASSPDLRRTEWPEQDFCSSRAPTTYFKPADVDAAADLLKTVDCMVMQFEIPLETVYYCVQFARKKQDPFVSSTLPRRNRSISKLWTGSITSFPMKAKLRPSPACQ